MKGASIPIMLNQRAPRSLRTTTAMPIAMIHYEALLARKDGKVPSPTITTNPVVIAAPITLIRHQLLTLTFILVLCK